MTLHSPSARGRMSGFSMVEILVGLVIGMLASLVVLQLFADNEARNRTASGSADAQTTGAITLYQLQTNIQRAGYGISSQALLNCNASWQVANGGATIAKPVGLAPVTINPTSTSGGVTTSLIPAGDANSDIVMVIYANGDSQPEGNEVLATTGAVYTVRSQALFAVGDRVVASLGTAADSCGTNTLNIDRVTSSVAATSAVTVSTAPGIAARALFNLGRGPNGANATPTTAMPTNGPSVLVYAVRSGALTVCDFNVNDCSLVANATSGTVWVPIAENIVALRAVYWKDNSGNLWDGSVTASDQTKPANACAWARVWALNVMLVTRSDERDKLIVTRASSGTVVSGNATLAALATGSAPAPTWGVAALDAAAPIVLGVDDTTDQEWRHYRYRAFQTLVPIRNITWLVPRDPVTGLVTSPTWCS